MQESVSALYRDGVLPKKWAVLLLLWNVFGEGVENHHLLQAVAPLTSQNLSTLLTDMEAEGLVERRTPLRDQRAVRIYLTEAGHKLALDVLSKMRKTTNAYAHAVGIKRRLIRRTEQRRRRQSEPH